MQQFPLNLLFKGERDYHQGGDLYNAVQEIAENFLGKKAWVDHIIFRGFAQYTCELVLSEPNTITMESVRAKCTIRHGEKLIIGTILETKNKVMGRYPFDENLVIKEAVLEGQCISQKNRTGFSAIEEIIVLTKFLHNRLLPAQSGRWIFSQLDLTEPFSIDKACCYAIELKQNLANRMTVSDIKQHDKIIGKIRFTVTPT